MFVIACELNIIIDIKNWCIEKMTNSLLGNCFKFFTNSSCTYSFVGFLLLNVVFSSC